MSQSKTHWENIYSAKQPLELSWTQVVPVTSLEIISSLKLPLSASIIDIGGGDSRLVDYLVKEGFQNITVLDISEKALNRSRERLGKDADKVKWIVADITEFQPTEKYDLWHDRAAFHFLTTPSQISAYSDLATNCIKQYLVMGTFSDSGPDKCSGLFIKKYSESTLEKQLSGSFIKLNCVYEDHITPFKTSQNFLFCSFKKVSEENAT